MKGEITNGRTYAKSILRWKLTKRRAAELEKEIYLDQAKEVDFYL